MAKLYIVAMLTYCISAVSAKKNSFLPCSTSPTPCGVDCSSTTGPTDFDVLIVGAGLAGLGAAREIELSNKLQLAAGSSDIITYLVLESSNRVGGRQIAAHWIVGGGAGKNPISQLGYGCVASVTVGSDFNQNMHFYKLDGTKFSPTDPVLANQTTRWAEAYACLEDTALNGIHNDAQDMTAQDTLRRCGWDPEYEHGDTGALQRNLEWNLMDFEYAQRPWTTSTWEGWPENTYEDLGSTSNLYVTDLRGTNELSAQEFHKHDICPKICLNRKVTKIDWGSSPIQVSTVAANDLMNVVKYTAKHVVSTVSTAVLDHELISFDPEITEKLENMRQVWNTSLYYEIPFQFGSYDGTSPQPFWPTDQEYISINLDVGLLGRCNLYHVMDYFYPGSNALVCTLTTEVIEELNLYNPAVVNGLLRESLGKVFPSLSSFNDCTPCNPPECTFNYRKPPTPTNGNPTNPQKLGVNECRYRLFQSKDNENWKGSYPTWRYGGTYANLAAHWEPLSNSKKNSIVPAGDSTCYYYWGFQHGALWSGVRAGATVLKSLGVQPKYHPDTPYYCEKRASL